MQRSSNIALIVVMVLIAVLAACKKVQKFPITPRIDYLSFEKIYNPGLELYDRGVLSFSYEDGDGDIGLNSGDTMPPYNPESEYHYNLVITFFEMQNAVLTEVPILWFNPDTEQYDTLTLSARIPDLTPSGINKSISGEIFDTLFIYNFNSSYDTIKFEAYIVDRALHKSNIISTPLIVR